MFCFKNSCTLSESCKDRGIFCCGVKAVIDSAPEKLYIHWGSAPDSLEVEEAYINDLPFRFLV
jgi:hypothetical protein